MLMHFYPNSILLNDMKSIVKTTCKFLNCAAHKGFFFFENCNGGSLIQKQIEKKNYLCNETYITIFNSSGPAQNCLLCYTGSGFNNAQFF